ncbi:MAG: 2-amino-4-hydroxy-6-hydroxymethyldihydropteridine diphosphokinase [Candidatus Cloacimonadota bacterium]|nr:2-amino-4-hydroxy-6-hydroxymethyldihydropteridine diphosphokinase [Candidatus Cloacimonadota bacterium]
MLVYLGLGSNLGNRKANILSAIKMLRNSDNITISKTSKIRETLPYGKTDQPQFLNCITEIDTDLIPTDLLNQTQKIENILGRVRHEHWGPRTIDIDILFYEDKIIFTSQLQVPHPYFSKREFVLQPMVEIAPNFIDPISKKTIKKIYKEFLCRN